MQHHVGNPEHSVQVHVIHRPVLLKRQREFAVAEKTEARNVVRVTHRVVLSE
jgi:hypothetical protein